MPNMRKTGGVRGIPEIVRADLLVKGGAERPADLEGLSGTIPGLDVKGIGGGAVSGALFKDAKLTVIGGGSTYTPELIMHLVQSQSLSQIIGAVTLYDIDPARTKVVFDFCRRVLASFGSNLVLNWTTDPGVAFDGADILFNLMRAGKMEGRFADERKPTFMPGLTPDQGLVGQETVGEGGFLLFHRQAQALEALLPYFPKGVKVFNFANPSGMLSQWLSAVTSLPSLVLGLCNIPFVLKENIANVLMAQRPELAGLDVFDVINRVEILDSVGLNHNSVFGRFLFDGKDVTAEVIEGLTHPPANLDPKKAAEDLSAFPEFLGLGYFLNWYFGYRLHTDEYEKQMRAASPEETRAWKVRGEEQKLLIRYRDSTEPVKQILEGLLGRGGANYARMATLALGAMLTNSGARHIVNTSNRLPDGTAFIPWLSADTYVEAPCLMCAEGAVIDKGSNRSLPDQLRLGIQREAEAQNLWIMAHMPGIDAEEKLALMRQALRMHPLIGDRLRAEDRPELIDKIIETLDDMVEGLPPLVI